MRVALDMSHVRQTDAGTARYARGLSGALRARSDVIVEEVGGGPMIGRGLRKKLLTAEQDLLWYPYAGRHAARVLDADIYHCPAFRAPVTRGRPALVVTVHDLVSLRFPQTMPRWSRFYTRATLRRVLDSADLLITPSADTANDLEQLAGVGHDRIRVIWNAVDDAFYAEPATQTILNAPYVLFVGTAEPRKNLQRLGNAVELLRRRGLDYKLVIAGGGGWGGVNLPGPHVIRLGKQTDAELHRLYAGAACLAQVSLHEGFGLPVAEAMAAGAPVVISGEGALPEVAGDAAVSVDAYDEESIASGIERAVAERDQLVTRGRKRAALFRWDVNANLHVDAYRKAL
ncbi:MAG: glycosyltransferase family 4 protein [Gemmatimonadaceae bacterium]|nr:glycosyltransferase family 4 protein [Gemmatimonadaceae bacterium]